MTRQLVFEDEVIRRYEIRDDAGELVGYDEQPTHPPPPPCPTCGGTGYLA